MPDTTITGAASGATGGESSLSNWAGPYVTNMLGQGQALAQQPYQAYQGPLTAGASNLQQQAFSGIGSLQMPTQQQMQFTPTQFSGGIAQQYMNPYLQASLEPQIAEARRQAEIQRIGDTGRLVKAGAFGGSRQAVMESEGNRNLLANLANITGQGYKSAFDIGQQQFNTEQDRQRAAAQQAADLGFKTLGTQAELGAVQRGIESEGIAADRAQFEQERLEPYKQVQFMQSLLQGLPISAQSYSYPQQSLIEQITQGAGGVSKLLEMIFGPRAAAPATAAPATAAPAASGG
jgi:hypothetical protein